MGFYTARLPVNDRSGPSQTPLKVAVAILLIMWKDYLYWEFPVALFAHDLLDVNESESSISLNCVL